MARSSRSARGGNAEVVDQAAIRAGPEPEPLGDLVGQQAADGQARHTSGRAPPRRGRPACTEQCGQGEPQLGVVSSPGEPRHGGVEQWTGRIGDRFENLPVQAAQAGGDLVDAAGLQEAFGHTCL